MKLFEEVAEQTSSIETLGTVAELVGKGGKIAFSTSNLLGDKLILVDLKRKDGATQRVYCSPALSAYVRKNKMEKQDLINFVGGLNIAETTNEEGEKRFKVIMNQGVMVEGAITGTVAAKPVNVDEIPW